MKGRQKFFAVQFPEGRNLYTEIMFFFHWQIRYFENPYDGYSMEMINVNNRNMVYAELIISSSARLLPLCHYATRGMYHYDDCYKTKHCP